MRDVSSAACPGESNSTRAGIVRYPMQANVVSIYCLTDIEEEEVTHTEHGHANKASCSANIHPGVDSALWNCHWPLLSENSNWRCCTSRKKEKRKSSGLEKNSRYITLFVLHFDSMFESHLLIRSDKIFALHRERSKQTVTCKLLNAFTSSMLHLGFLNILNKRTNHTSLQIWAA